MHDPNLIPSFLAGPTSQVLQASLIQLLTGQWKSSGGQNFQNRARIFFGVVFCPERAV